MIVEASESAFTLTIHGITITLLITLLGMSFKQYNIYKVIKERVNIIWREYCRDHNIPYNALGDDKLMDIINGGRGK